MLLDLIIFPLALLLVIKSSTVATQYATKLAESFHLTKYVVGFIIVAIISILPETFISINAALQRIPAFGLGALFGSNVADLTLVFAFIIFLTGRGLKIESKILANNNVYPFILLLPIILGFDGYYSRLEGAALVIVGVVFYIIIFKKSYTVSSNTKPHNNRLKNFLFLLLSMIVLLFASHLTVAKASELAFALHINPILIGMLIVGIGTTMPEFFFSLKSVTKRNESLAVGDILGTVLSDATIVVGILALISPFAFPPIIIYITGISMVISCLILFFFMRTGKIITRKEAVLLLGIYFAFVFIEFLVNR